MYEDRAKQYVNENSTKRVAPRQLTEHVWVRRFKVGWLDPNGSLLYWDEKQKCHRSPSLKLQRSKGTIPLKFNSSNTKRPKQRDNTVGTSVRSKTLTYAHLNPWNAVVSSCCPRLCWTRIAHRSWWANPCIRVTSCSSQRDRDPKSWVSPTKAFPIGDRDISRSPPRPLCDPEHLNSNCFQCVNNIIHCICCW